MASLTKEQQSRGEKLAQCSTETTNLDIIHVYTLALQQLFMVIFYEYGIILKKDNAWFCKLTMSYF